MGLADWLERLYSYPNQPAWVSYGLPVLFGVLLLSAAATLGWISVVEYLVYVSLVTVIQIYAVWWARRRRKNDRDSN